MLIKFPRASDCSESEVTPESLYLSRRSLLGASMAGLAIAGLPAWARAAEASRMPMSRRARRLPGSPKSCRECAGRQ